MKEQLSKSSAGFTLIELLIAVAIVAIVSAIGIASFNSANRRNATNQSAADIQSLMRKLRTDATSGLKPPGCTATLNGTYITFRQNTNEYRYGVACFTGTTFASKTTSPNQFLPTSLHFTNAGSFSGATPVSHAEAYITFFFGFNGTVRLAIASTAAIATANENTYTNYNSSMSSYSYISIRYASGSNPEANFVYASTTGLVCHQRNGPSLGNNCAN